MGIWCLLVLGRGLMGKSTEERGKNRENDKMRKRGGRRKKKVRLDNKGKSSHGTKRYLAKYGSYLLD